MQSLNSNVLNEEEEGSEFQEFLTDNETPAPDENLLKIEDIEQLLRLLDRLPPREKMVLKLRFGLDGSPILTLEEVGRQLNCTNERIRQIQILALEKLHTMME